MLNSLKNQPKQPVFDNYQPIQENIQQPIRENPQRLQILTKIELYLSKFQHDFAGVQVHIFFSLNFSHSFLQLFKNFDAIRCSSLACLIDVLQR